MKIRIPDNKVKKEKAAKIAMQKVLEWGREENKGNAQENEKDTEIINEWENLEELKITTHVSKSTVKNKGKNDIKWASTITITAYNEHGLEELYILAAKGIIASKTMTMFPITESRTKVTPQKDKPKEKTKMELLTELLQAEEDTDDEDTETDDEEERDEIQNKGDNQKKKNKKVKENNTLQTIVEVHNESGETQTSTHPCDFSTHSIR